MILSIFFGFHDSCVTFSSSDKILLHLEAERVLRRKHARASRAEMDMLIKTGLDYLGKTIHDVDVMLLSEWLSEYPLEKTIVLGREFDPIITSHHNNHIGTTLPSGFNEFLAIVADGGSEDGTTKIYHYNHGDVELLADYNDDIITGKFYGTLTQLITTPDHAQAHQSDTGKVMGLAEYGDWDNEIGKIVLNTADELNKLHFDCKHLLETFSLSDNYKNYWLDKRRRNLAFTGQKIWLEKFYHIISKYKNISNNITLSGGCALNIVLNSMLIETKWFNNVYIPPVANDSGQSIGSILYHFPHIKCDYPFLGRSFGNIKEVDIEQIVQDIVQDRIIVWYEGSAEIGPRALGHRSFLGSPKSNELGKKLNDIIKRREPFRPISPMVAQEHAHDWFDGPEIVDKYMTKRFIGKKYTRLKAPAILYKPNHTSRIQTITAKDNPILHAVLLRLHEIGEPPMVMNTSLNLYGEPIVDTPEEAFRVFTDSGSDIIYINGKRFDKAPTL